MLTRWFIPLVVLPGTVLVIVPATVWWIAVQMGESTTLADWRSIQFWIGATLTVLGGFLATWSAAQFFRHGEGTPAPWDPPRRFVVRGPYRHVRNPMILGVILLLSAEAILAQSWWLAAWGLLFFIGNAVYLPMVEEPALARRFGEDYIEYCRHVRRWVPGFWAWDSTRESE